MLFGVIGPVTVDRPTVIYRYFQARGPNVFFRLPIEDCIDRLGIKTGEWTIISLNFQSTVPKFGVWVAHWDLFDGLIKPEVVIYTCSWFSSNGTQV